MIPIEVWDLVVDGVPLHRTERGEGFGCAIARAVDALISGAAHSESDASFPDECRAIERVVLTGGAANAVTWPDPRIRVNRTEERVYSAERAGRAILKRAGSKHGLVVDLGQSRLKISTAERRCSYARDFDAIPVSARPIERTGRTALVDFVARALRSASAPVRPDGAVLALPCAISANGVLGACSYPWQEGDGIVAEMLRAADLSEVPTWLVNDAELAAIGVADTADAANVTLVLTIGFGVGGAIVRRGA